MAKALFVDWCPKDVLDGTQTLSPWEELAYRRLLDLVVVTGDALPDDDRRLAWLTKTGRRWPTIKAALIAADKIASENGKIRVAEAEAALQKTARKMVQKSLAGRASAASRKSLTEKDTDATDVAPAAATAPQLPTNPLTHKEKREKERPRTPRHTASTAPVLLAGGSDERGTWDVLVKGYSPDKAWTWPVFRGPKPDEPGCWAPPDILARHGYPPVRSGAEVRHG